MFTFIFSCFPQFLDFLIISPRSTIPAKIGPIAKTTKANPKRSNPSELPFAPPQSQAFEPGSFL